MELWQGVKDILQILPIQLLLYARCQLLLMPQIDQRGIVLIPASPPSGRSDGTPTYPMNWLFLFLINKDTPHSITELIRTGSKGSS